MPRPLVLSNGNLYVAYDATFTIRDLTWPYVGQPNHLSGNRARLGLWLDGHFSWLSDEGWQREPAYEPDTLITAASAEHAGLQVRLLLRDGVHHRHDILLRQIEVTNCSSAGREGRLFLTHDFHIAETDIGDTAFYNPFLDAIIHYKRDYYFLIAARSEAGGIYQYATGIKQFGGAEGTWRDAEDGSLSMNPVAQGSVDSALSVRFQLPPNGTVPIRAWMCAGHSLEEARRLHALITDEGFENMLRDTRHYWVSWSDRGMDRVATLPAPLPAIFRRSLLTIRANSDARGAILAANDSDIMETARRTIPTCGPATVRWSQQRSIEQATRR